MIITPGDKTVYPWELGIAVYNSKESPFRIANADRMIRIQYYFKITLARYINTFYAKYFYITKKITECSRL